MDFNDKINLNDDEKRVFLKAILKLIVADGIIDIEETKIVKKIGMAYRLTKEMLAEAKLSFKTELTDEDLEKITTLPKRLELLKCLCLLAAIDNRLDDTELNLIVNIANRLEISREKLLEINQLVQDILLLREKNNLIMLQSD